jgi:hypothetical protein
MLRPTVNPPANRRLCANKTILIRTSRACMAVRTFVDVSAPLTSRRTTSRRSAGHRVVCSTSLAVPLEPEQGTGSTLTQNDGPRLKVDVFALQRHLRRLRIITVSRGRARGVFTLLALFSAAVAIRRLQIYALDLLAFPISSEASDRSCSRVLADCATQSIILDQLADPLYYFIHVRGGQK